MRCATCGNYLADHDGVCPVCAKNLNRVQVLSPEEREGFNGITIEQDNRHERDRAAETKTAYYKTLVFNTASAGALSKLILTSLVLLAAALFLPLVLLFAVTFGVSWLSNRTRQ